MHMISKKDLSDAEMDTLTKSCSPTMYVKELDIFLTMKVLDNTAAVLSLGKLCDENGYFYECSLKTGFGFLATRRTSFLVWFHACQIRLQDLTHQLRGHFQDRRVIAQHLLPARLHHSQ